MNLAGEILNAIMFEAPRNDQGFVTPADAAVATVRAVTAYYFDKGVPLPKDLSAEKSLGLAIFKRVNQLEGEDL